MLQDNHNCNKLCLYINIGYLEAGAEILETNTFNGTTISQSDYNTQDYTYEINKAATRLALEACLEVSSSTGVPRFVAGAMGPTNRTLSVSPSGRITESLIYVVCIE